MTFTRTENVLTSADGRFRIERAPGFRYNQFAVWDTKPTVDWGWMHITNCDSEIEAKEVCRLSKLYGGTP